MAAQRLDRAYFFFTACYLAQGMSGIIYEPLSYLLKDAHHLGPSQSAGFIWWMTFPMLIKPVFGLLSDLLPIRGHRRRPQMIAACLIWAGALAALASMSNPGYGRLLALMILVNLGLVLGDIVCDAIMVEQGRREGKTGPYQAVQIGILYATIVVTGLGGGWLAAHSAPRQVFALAALFPMLALTSVVWVSEPEAAASPLVSARAIASVFGSKRFWAVSALIFLWSFSPFLGTAQFYYESETLRLGPVMIGWLGTVGGLSGAVGAFGYGRLIGVWTLRQWLRAAVLIGTPLSLLYFFFLGPVSAALVTAVVGVVGIGFRLALMDLAARSCPEGGEAAAFAAYMAVFNIAAAGSNLAGGWLLERLCPSLTAYGAAAVLVAMGGVCTASCWPLLEPALEGLLPTAPLGGRRDSGSCSNS